MNRSWIENELETANLEDQRLNARFSEVLSSLSDRPNVSIPAACGGYAETMAAYRFFDNPKVTFEKIQKSHRDATEKRIAEHEVVLCVQDTTELDLTRPDQQIQGAGLIGSGTKKRGAYLHLLEAFVPDATPLGSVWAKILIRAEEERAEEDERQKQKRLTSTPLEQKESFRWLEGYRATIEIAKRNPNTKCVCVGDSESDMFEVFAEPRSENSHFLIRACQDRSVLEGDNEFHRLRDTVVATDVLDRRRAHVRARQPCVSCTENARQAVRKSREAELEVRCAAVTIRVPSHLRHRYEPVAVNVVMVSEPSPPQGESPIEWILLSTLPISTLEEVTAIIEYYETRWMIEVFFKTLKSGCKVESLQFEQMDRLLPCLGVYLIVAWRVLMICRLGRRHPDWSCEILFDESEWKSTYRIMHPGKKLPKKPPSLDFMIRLVGELGGWISTPGKTELPGPKTTWIGLQRVRDFAIAWKMFGPEAEKYKKDV